MAYLDLHSHVLPSGDDGVESLPEAVDLICSAAERGTTVLYTTPHVNATWPLDEQRQEALEHDFRHLALEAQSFDVELRLGFEVAAPLLLGDDPSRYRLEGLDAVLLEAPIPVHDVTLTDLLEAGSSVEDEGLTPILAHPERCAPLAEEPEILTALVERGWLLQVNAGSFLGGYEDYAGETAWRLLERGHLHAVGSDAHGWHVPPFLDEAYREVVGEVGHRRAEALFSGQRLAECVSEPTRVGALA